MTKSSIVMFFRITPAKLCGQLQRTGKVSLPWNTTQTYCRVVCLDDNGDMKYNYLTYTVLLTNVLKQ